MTWRAKANRAITKAMAEAEKLGLSGKELEKFVQLAYPFGERENHPYKIWCHEFNRLVRGSKKPFTTPKKSSQELSGEWPMTDEQRRLFE